MRRLLRGGRRMCGLPVRQHVDEFSRLGQVQLVARLFFDRLRIVFQGLDFLLELLVVLRQLLNVPLKSGVFLFLVPQGQVAVAAKDFMYKQGKAQ